MSRINIALYIDQLDYRPAGMISIQESQLVEVKTIIYSANAMYNNLYLEEWWTAEERVDYIIEALHEAGIDVENVFTSAASKIYL